MSTSKPSFPAHEEGLLGLRKLHADHEARTAQDPGYHSFPRKEVSVPLTLDSKISDPFSNYDGIIPGPNIQWYPSFTMYRARIEALAGLRSSMPKRVPDGYPDAVAKPWVWSGKELASREGEYVIHLDQADIKEIEEALRSFTKLQTNIKLERVNKRTFPLPKLKRRLQEVALTLHEGIGFTIIRGLEPRRYTAMDNMIIYLGITSYVAEKRGCQDSDGNMISEYRMPMVLAILTKGSPCEGHRVSDT
jgi:hypothetical protein